MNRVRIGDIEVTFTVQGVYRYSKVSYPFRYGSFSEIAYHGFTFQFNLNGELKYVQGSVPLWPHPAEWVKRTSGNDWTYYCSGEYRELFDLYGEYYLPCPPYPTNSIFSVGSVEKQAVSQAQKVYTTLHESIADMSDCTVPAPARAFLKKVATHDIAALTRKAQQLHAICNGPIPVLPPEARHVDYDVIPLIVSRGCLYRCSFCSVKEPADFHILSHREIVRQVEQLRLLYGDDLKNYKAIFIGQHDALAAGADLLAFAGYEGLKGLALERSLMK